MDRDAGSNGEVQYSIKSSRGKGRFAIHPHTGTVYSVYTFTAGQEYDLMVCTRLNQYILIRIISRELLFEEYILCFPS